MKGNPNLMRKACPIYLYNMAVYSYVIVTNEYLYEMKAINE